MTFTEDEFSKVFSSGGIRSVSMKSSGNSKFFICYTTITANEGVIHSTTGKPKLYSAENALAKLRSIGVIDVLVDMRLWEPTAIQKPLPL